MALAGLSLFGQSAAATRPLKSSTARGNMFTGAIAVMIETEAKIEIKMSDG